MAAGTIKTLTHDKTRQETTGSALKQKPVCALADASVALCSLDLPLRVASTDKACSVRVEKLPHSAACRLVHPVVSLLALFLSSFRALELQDRSCRARFSVFIVLKAEMS